MKLLVVIQKGLLVAGGDGIATQKWRTKPQNVWTQQKPDQPSQWANGNLTQKDRAIKDAWAKK